MGRRTVGPVLALAVGVTLLAAPQASGASTDSGLTGTVRTLTAAAPESRVKLQVHPHHVGPGEKATLTAQLIDAVTGLPIADAALGLRWGKVGKSGWQQGEVALTGPGGRAEWSEGPAKTRRYRVIFAGTEEHARSVSDVRRISVKPVVTATMKRDWVRPDGVVKLTGQVTPAYAGEQVSLQRRVDGQWRKVTRVVQGGQGRFTFRIGGMDAYGTQNYRVALEERDVHLGVISSPMRLTTVRLVTYHVETRGKVRGALDKFKERTAEIYADPRGWSRANVHFKRVKSGGAFSLVLSQAKYVPSFGSICDHYWSCRVGRYVIINENRWRHGTPYFKRSGGTMAEYRAMVTNHETGHWFGLGHATCGGRGQAAPVMMQQSKGLFGCLPNPWPLPGEIARAH